MVTYIHTCIGMIERAVRRKESEVAALNSFCI